MPTATWRRSFMCFPDDRFEWPALSEYIGFDRSVTPYLSRCSSSVDHVTNSGHHPLLRSRPVVAESW